MSRPLLLAALCAFAVLSGSCGPRDLQAPESLVGHWEGHVAWHDATLAVELDVESRGDSLVARLSAPAVAVSRMPVGPIVFDSPRVRFALRDAGGEFRFEGWLRRGLVVGAFSSPTLGGERNPSRLPQLSLRRRETRTRPTPWPGAAAGTPPPVARAAEASFGEWLRARARVGP